MAKNEIWLEAESFEQKGGWVVDQQSIPVLHSAYLMAHGMGTPVENASTSFTVSKDATYSVWCLTRDWTAPWQVADPAGKFRIAIDGAPLETILGTCGAAWDWQKAGSLALKKGIHTIELCDLTGFNGRCDAIYLTDSDETPSADRSVTDEMRRRLSRGETETDPQVYDLVVVGGGISGLCTAIAASRSGVKTLLINDRTVLGGCNSSEIRVGLGGRIKEGEYEKLGDVVREIAPLLNHPSIYNPKCFEDDRKQFAAELAGVKLLLDTAVTDLCMNGKSIEAITALKITEGKEITIRARLFADCSGDGILARLGGATLMYGKEGREDYGESLAPAAPVRMTMGHSIRWYSEETPEPVPFPDLDWNLAFNEKNFLNCVSGDWEQETGFQRDMVEEIEYIRDCGLRSIYANWSYQKNHLEDNERFRNRRLVWVSSIGGKRESYRVMGDYLLTQHDIDAETEYPDGTANATWGIDIHYPDTANQLEFGEAFRSFAYHRGMPRPCAVPYRCFYSKDVDNLFLGGRLISATHVAFSALRVMRTLGMFGEVAGLAAGICKAHNCLPRAVYTDHLEELKARMKEGVEIPSSFACGDINNIEKYHFKDIGWWHLDTGVTSDPITPEGLEKFRLCTRTMGIQHTHPMPKDWE